MPGPIDLHAHSSVSDGTETPAELVRSRGRSAGLGVVALTDHDSTADGRRPSTRRVGTGMTLVPGLELSTQLDYASVHVLGYLVDPADPALGRRDRMPSAPSELHRAEAMVRRISADYALNWDDVLAQTTPGATVGRPHIADALVARGHVPDRSAAFQSILHWRGGYYQPHQAPPPIDGVRLIARGRRGAGDRASGSAGPQRVLTDTRMRAARRRRTVRPRARPPRQPARSPGALGAISRRGSGWSPPGRATTTARASRTGWARTPRRPRSTRRSSPRRPEAPRSSADRSSTLLVQEFLRVGPAVRDRNR